MKDIDSYILYFVLGLIFGTLICINKNIIDIEVKLKPTPTQEQVIEPLPRWKTITREELEATL